MVCSNDRILLSLLRTALWGEPADPGTAKLDAGAWQAVYAQACRHSVQGVAFDAVRNLPADAGPDLALSAQWLLDAGSIARRYGRIKDVTGRLADVWQRLGIDAVHLKGTVLADMYPVPEHRVCGDVDWYFAKESDRKAAGGWAARKGLDPRLDSDGTVHYVLDGVVIEHHILPFDPTDPMETLVMLNLHILKHTMVRGAGLRQLSDLAVAYYRLSGIYDTEALKRDLKSKGLLKWTGLLHCVLTDYIGLPEQYLPWTGRTEKMGSDAEVLAGLVLEDGDFGLSKNKKHSGQFKRLALMTSYAPWRLIKRYAGLAFGHAFKRNKRFIIA